MFEEEQNTARREHQGRIARAQAMGLKDFAKLEMGAAPKVDRVNVIIREAVERKYPDVSRADSERISRELVLAPRDSRIKIGTEEIRVEDLQYQIASSIELINSETTSSQEYFRWIDDTLDIIKHMNDGKVTVEDLQERNDFLDMSYQRETELMVCMGLYQNSTFPDAKVRYEELRLKLDKLRQMRSAIQQTTKDKVDHETNEQEYKKALEYYGVFKLYKGHELADQAAEDVLRNLGRSYYDGRDHGYRDNGYGIYHGSDRDMQPGYSHYDRLREKVLFSMSSREYDSRYDHSMGEELVLRRMGNENLSSRQALIEHIERLSGRRPPLKDAPEYNYSEVRKRAFDIDRFRSLSGREMGGR